MEKLAVKDYPLLGSYSSRASNREFNDGVIKDAAYCISETLTEGVIRLSVMGHSWVITGMHAGSQKIGL